MGNWKIIKSAQGIQLKSLGEAGSKILLIPGMEGSGESCMDLAEWIYHQSFQKNDPVQFIMIDGVVAHEEPLTQQAL